MNLVDQSQTVGYRQVISSKFFLKGSWWGTIIPMCDEVLSWIRTHPATGLVYRKHHGNVALRWRTNQIIIFPWQRWMVKITISVHSKKVGWLWGSRIIVLRFSHLRIFGRPSSQEGKLTTRPRRKRRQFLDFCCSRKLWSGVENGESTKRSRLENWNPSPLWCWYTLQ